MVKRLKGKLKKKGQSPQEFVDEIVSGIQNLWDKLDISYDDFIRTTEDRHKKVVQKIFEQLKEQGDIYLDHYEAGTVRPVNPFIQNTSWKMGNVRIAGEL